MAGVGGRGGGEGLSGSSGTLGAAPFQRSDAEGAGPLSVCSVLHFVLVKS